jgi:hypothetical protein
MKSVSDEFTSSKRDVAAASSPAIVKFEHQASRRTKHRFRQRDDFLQTGGGAPQYCSRDAATIMQHCLGGVPK